MDKIYFWILCVGFLSCVYAEITITELHVPQSLPLDGYHTDAEFDCIYKAENETGLEVKWFFNDDYHQIYQWIPEFPKRGSALGLLKDRIDLSYAITNDSDTRYRGFKINNITQDLSGNYTCKISSLLNDASYTKQMIIYSPADSELEFNLNETLINCSAYGISPMPVLDFYIIAQNGSQIDIVENLEPLEPDSDGLYNITATHDFSEYNYTLTGTTKFVCNVSIPGTSYFLSKEVLHFGDNSGVRLTAFSYTILISVLTTLWK